MARPRTNYTVPVGCFDVDKEMAYYSDKPYRNRTKHDGISTIEKYNENTKVAVEKLSLDGKVLGEYSSLSEAARAHGLCKTGVQEVINGKCKTAAGFKWRKKI